MEGIGHTKNILRCRLSQKILVIGSKLAVVVHIAITEIARLDGFALEGNRCAIVSRTVGIDFCLSFPDTYGIVHPECVDRFAYHQHIGIIAATET